MSDIPAEELKRRMRDAIAARDAARGAMDFSEDEAGAAYEAMPWVEPHLQPDERAVGSSGLARNMYGEGITPQTDEPAWYEMGHTQVPSRDGMVERGPSRQEIAAALAAREDDER